MAKTAQVRCVKGATSCSDEPREMYRVKFQRPLFTTAASPMLLIYSKCGTIPPTMLPETEDLRATLGSRRKAYFLCKLDGVDLVIAGETHNDNW